MGYDSGWWGLIPLLFMLLVWSIPILFALHVVRSLDSLKKDVRRIADAVEARSQSSSSSI